MNSLWDQLLNVMSVNMISIYLTRKESVGQ